MHLEGSDLHRPIQALVVVALFGQHGDESGHTNAIGAHGGNGTLTGLVEELNVERFRVFAAELEDVPDFNAALQGERALSLRCGIAFANFRRFDKAVWGEVAAAHHIDDVTLRGVCTGDPRGAFNNTWIGEYRDVISCEGFGAHVALDEEGVVFEVFLYRHLDGCGFQGSLEALKINLAVAGHEDAHQLRFLTGLGDLHDDALQRVSCGDLTAVDSNSCAAGPFHQCCDGLGVGGVVLHRRGLALNGAGLAGLSDHGFDVGCVNTVGCAHEGVLTIGRYREKLF